jgi:predicted nuclease of predicted toxin-antitoxin system
VRFLLDENVSYRVCTHLKAAGHDAVHVGEIGLTSTADVVITERAREEDRILVSCDHDFVQILFASGDTRPSLVLVRDVDARPSAELAAMLLSALPGQLTDLLLAGAIATLTPDRVRVRPLPLRPRTRG